MGSFDAECDLGSISGGLSGESKMLRASDQNDRMTHLFKSLRVGNQKKTPKMEFFLDRLKMAGHPVIRVIRSLANFFLATRGEIGFPSK